MSAEPEKGDSTVSPLASDQSSTTVEPPSPDVAPTEAAARVPGAPRAGYTQLPTGPVPFGRSVVDVVDAPIVVAWAPGSPASRGFAGSALAVAIAGLAVSLVVGWGFPLGLIAIVIAIIALRSPVESRPLAIWALCLATVSVLYSVGWLLWAATQANLLG